MKIITFYNIKGGIGKTTLNLSLAKRLSKEGKKILLIDADLQANLTELFYKVNHDDKTLIDALIEGESAEDIIIKNVNPNFDNIDLIPSNIDLCTLSEDISTMRAREKVVARWFKSNLETLSMYDYIIVDLSPSIELLNRNFLYIMDGIILVAQHGDISSIRGAEKFMQIYTQDLSDLEIEDHSNKVLLLNAVESGNRSVLKFFDEHIKNYPTVKEYLLDSKLSKTDAIRRATLENLDIQDLDKNYRSKKIEEQFSNLISELVERKVL